MSKDEHSTSAARGAAILELIRFNFGDERGARANFAAVFGLNSATVWPWCKQVGRQGIPHRLSDPFADFVDKGRLRLPEGRQVSDYLRPAPSSRFEKSERSRLRNEDLIALFFSTILHPELGPSALEQCMSDPAFVVRVLNPSYWLRWGYHSGGVPDSYKEPFTTALIKSGIAELLMGYDPKDRLNTEFFIKVNSLFAVKREPSDEVQEASDDDDNVE